MSVAAHGGRAALRPMTDSEPPLFEDLYTEAEGTPRKGGEVVVIARRDDSSAIGVIDYQEGEPAAGWLTVRFIALAKQHRGWGYGSEAVRLLEEMSAAERFRADVDAGNGLALYFWLRLGYRPAVREEMFWRSEGDGDIIPMIRVVDADRIASVR